MTEFEQQARDMRKQWDQMISDAIASGLDGNEPRWILRAPRVPCGRTAVT